MASNYANLHHGYIEKIQVLNEINNPIFKHIILHRSYIDYLFILFQGDLGSLNSFHQYLNYVMDHLKFTLTFSEDTLDFLEVHVVTDLFKKKTESINFLHSHSCHLPSIKRGLYMFLEVLKGLYHLCHHGMWKLHPMPIY